MSVVLETVTVVEVLFTFPSFYLMRVSSVFWQDIKNPNQIKNKNFFILKVNLIKMQQRYDIKMEKANF